MTEKLPQGRPIKNTGPQTTYSGPNKPSARIPRQSAPIKTPDDVPGELVEVSESAIRIQRDGNTITKEGVAVCISKCIQWGVGKEISVNQAAKKLNVHRHTLNRILKNYENNVIGAINIIDDVSLDDFNDIVISDLMSGYFDRVDMTDTANKELKRRLEQNPEEISTKALLDIDKNASQQTLNTMRFLMERETRDNEKAAPDDQLTDETASELKDIFAKAAKRLATKENVILDND